jgi:hypothetical protein
VARPATMQTAVRSEEKSGHQTLPGDDSGRVRPGEEPGNKAPRAPAQYSMIRVKNGVMPPLRTGLTVTLPALPDASSIWPLPR